MSYGGFPYDIALGYSNRGSNASQNQLSFPFSLTLNLSCSWTEFQVEVGKGNIEEMKVD